MISFRQVSKNFGKVQALKQVSLELHRDNSYALIGPNGSGKTTLIKALLGLVIPASGEIMVDEKSIRNDWQYREKIGYMPQIGHYPANMRIGQLFDMIRNIHKHSTNQDEELVNKFGLDKISDKRMHTLSGGTRQKVSAALTFLFNPPVLILDEPTAGLDPVSVEVLKEKIIQQREAGKLILVTSHIMSDLEELAARVVYLHEGSIRYNNAMTELKAVTGESRLGKAIARFIIDMEKPEANG
jgi:Cu-processing system ATP-binding protein